MLFFFPFTGRNLPALVFGTQLISGKVLIMVTSCFNMRSKKHFRNKNYKIFENFFPFLENSQNEKNNAGWNHQFLSLGEIKKFWQHFRIDQTLLARNWLIIIGQCWPEIHNWIFKNMVFFDIWGNFSNFLSSIYDFALKLRVNH